MLEQNNNKNKTITFFLTLEFFIIIASLAWEQYKNIWNWNINLIE